METKTHISYPQTSPSTGLFPRSVLIISGVSLVARIALAAALYPGFDEAYYFSYSLRPSLSYFDHPPVVAWLAGLFPFLLGQITPLTIRLGAILAFSLSSLLFYRLSRRWLTARESVIAFVLLNLTPIFALGAGAMILPDAGLLFFWICALFFHVSLINNPERTVNWLLAGTFTGLTMLSKYHGLFLAISIMSYSVIGFPRIFRRPGPYLYSLFALIVFSPVILWNYQHGFASFLFQGGRAIGHNISLQRLLQAIGGQAAYLTPMIFVPLVYVMYLTLSRGLLKRDLEYRLYFFFGTLPVVVINFISLFKPILPHWTMPGYVILLVPLARHIQAQLNSRPWFKKYVYSSIVFIFMLMIVGFLHVKFGIFHLEKMAERKWMSKQNFYKDATLDLIGWDQINHYLEAHNIHPDSTFLFTHKWFLSGEAEFATRGKFTVMCFNKTDSRGFGIWDASLDMRGRDGLFISTNVYAHDPHKHYSTYFESISAPDSILVERGGVISKTIYFHHCKNLLKNYPVFNGTKIH
ncbi:MAG: ArnT family glycosyltransferase [Candidatus Zhuqueibacterota bacterium]